MGERVLIQMTFDTGYYMKFDFIYKILKEFDLLRDGVVELNYIESFEYKEEELYQKLHDLNFRVHRLALMTNNDKIKFEISNPLVITFSQLKIECNKNDENIENYINILLKLFGDNFYMIHVLGIEEYDKGTQFLKSKILKKLSLLSIYEDVGINIGMSRNMYFGKHMYNFIDKETLLKCPHVHNIINFNNIINIRIYDSYNQKRKLSMEHQIRNYLRIDEIAKNLKNDVYMNHNYGQYFLKGYEKYQSHYFYGKYVNMHQENKYIFPMYHFDLVLKKYKNTCFENVDEDFGAGEIVGFLVYKTDDGSYYKKPNEAEAFIMVEMFNITSQIKEYAQKEGYTVQKVKKNQYLLEKEDDKSLDRFNYFTTKKDDHYRIRLLVHKNLLEEKEIKKIVSEYDKMVKSSVLKEI